MRRSLLAVTAAASLMLGACSQQKSSLPVIDIAAAMEAPVTENIDDILEVSLVLNPEVTDSTMIDYLTLAGIIDSKYYVAGFSGNMMIFNADGECLSSFDRQGNGPGEYGRYGNPAANVVTKGWTVFTATAPLAYNYTASGEFIKRDSLPALMTPKNLGTGWLGTSNGFDNDTITLYYFNNNLQITDSLNTAMTYRVFRNQGGAAIFFPDFLTLGNNAEMYWNDTIYNVSDPAKGLIPTATVNVGNMRMPADVDPTKLENGQRDQYIHEYIYTTAKHYLLWVKYNHRVYALFFEKATGKQVATLSGDESEGIKFNYNGNSIKLSPLHYSDENVFYFSASDATMSELTDNEDANPALFSVKIK